MNELNDDERREVISALAHKLTDCIDVETDSSMTIEIIFLSVLQLLCGVIATMASAASDAQKLKAFRREVLQDVESRMLQALDFAKRNER